VHAATIQGLWRAARAGRLPHAFLFEGRAGIGKFLAARWFAMGCLCERGPDEPCGSCGPCKRVLSGGAHGNHADLFVLDPEDPFLAGDFERSQQIRIGRIAYRPEDGELEHPDYCVERFLDLSRSEGGFRPVLIREAQRMNEAAQNALLKTLEEPRPGTVMVLETHRTALLRPPVKSRCIRIRFDPLTLEQCEEVLRAAGLEPDAAHALARLAGGSPGSALAMARNGTREICARLAAVARGEREPLAAAAELWELEAELELDVELTRKTQAGKTQAAGERERARVVLDLAQALLADAWRARAGAAPERLAHGESAAGLARRASERELFARGEALLVARADIDRNLAPSAVLQRALLVLAGGVAGRARAGLVDGPGGG
jgi:DNA polymerase-3 subunit delta'